MRTGLLSLVSLTSLVALAACGGAPPAPAAPKAAPPRAESAPSAHGKTQVLASDTAVTTPSGAVFEASGGWSLTKRDDGVITLRSPEKDVTLHFVEVDEPDGERAIGAAWKKADPTFARKIELRVPAPARDGWDGITQVSYVTKAEEARGVVAIARRKDARQYVVLIDGTNDGLGRRAAQLATAVTSLRAKGIERETFAGKKAHALDGERLAAFEAFVEEARKEADVPGVAIAIVQDDEVVLAKGYGVRELGKKDPVTPKTLFMIGSTTKSLTTLMMAKLVDDKKLGWHTPMTELLPSFALGDAKATSALDVQRTVCACTGMPRQDMALLFEWKKSTPESRLAEMKDMKPTTGFGETFQYSNGLVAAGGFAAAHAAVPNAPLGKAYASALRSIVLEPLGMRATTLDTAVAAKADHASPHNVDADFHATTIPLADEGFTASIAPSGGAWSNVEDMARVLRMELAGGELDGKRVVSAENLAVRRTPQVKIADELSYGIGLFIDENAGARTVGHGGNTLGFTSDFLFLPEHRVGLVVLANAGQANAFRSALRRRFIEILFDGRAEAKEDLETALARRKKILETELAKVTRTPSPELLKTIAGTYESKDLGKLVVRADPKGGAIADAGEWSSHVGEKTEEDGTKKVFFLDPPFVGVELLVKKEGDGATLVLEEAQDPHVFSRTKK